MTDFPANSRVEISYIPPLGSVMKADARARDITWLLNGLLVETDLRKKLFIPFPRLLLIEEV